MSLWLLNAASLIRAVPDTLCVFSKERPPFLACLLFYCPMCSYTISHLWAFWAFVYVTMRVSHPVSNAVCSALTRVAGFTLFLCVCFWPCVSWLTLISAAGEIERWPALGEDMSGVLHCTCHCLAVCRLLQWALGGLPAVTVRENRGERERERARGVAHEHTHVCCCLEHYAASLPLLLFIVCRVCRLCVL